MRRSIENQELINAKCRLLEALGFEVCHEDSDVEFNSVSIDFSATANDEKSIIYTAMNAMIAHGISAGRAKNKHDRHLLVPVDNQDPISYNQPKRR